jgi:hypothetical protein
MTKKKTEKIKPPEAPWAPGQRAGAVTQAPIPVKEAKLLKALIVDGKRPKEAVVEAGYTGANLQRGTNAKDLCEFVKSKHPNINVALLESLEAAGVTPDYIVSKVKGLCEAKKQLPVRKIKTKSEGIEVEEIEYADFDDHHAQHKGVNTLLDILPGARAPKRVEVTQQTFEQKVSIHAEIQQNPAEAMKLIQSLIEQKKITEVS